MQQKNHLTQQEVESIIKAIRKHSRYPIRDQLLILMLFRHGLRVHQALSLTWGAFDFYSNSVLVQKDGVHSFDLKLSNSIVQPLSSEVIRMANALKKKTKYSGGYVFLSQRDAPMAAQTVYAVIRNMSKKAGIPYHVNSAMFRGGCVNHLASKGMDPVSIKHYLGLKSLKGLLKYLPERGRPVRSFWD